MRRYLLLGIVGVVFFFGIGGLALWWLIDTVRQEQSTSSVLSGAVVSLGGLRVTAAVGLEMCQIAGLHADENAEQVQLSVTVNRAATGCQTPVARQTSIVEVRLAAPLGARRLVDEDGDDIVRVDEDGLLPVTYLPAGIGRTARLVILPVVGGISVERVYDTVSVTEGTAPRVFPTSRTLRWTVAGHPVVASVEGPGIYATWRDDSIYVTVHAGSEGEARRMAEGLY